MTPNMVLRGLLKFAAVAIAAGVVGILVGIGLAALSGDDDSASLAPQTTSAPSTEAEAPTSTLPAPPTTSTPTTTTGTATSPFTTGSTRSRTPRVQVLSAVLYPARTASGRARRRARVVLRVRVTNRLTETLALEDPQLLVGTDRVSVDRRAEEAAGALLEPLDPSDDATGQLRYETAGDVTQRLTSTPRARLRIADRTVAVSIRISPLPDASG